MKRSNSVGDNREDIKELYPTSVHNQQCIGPCYHSNTKIIHPLTLDEIIEVNHPFCPVHPFSYADPETGKERLVNFDKCFVPTAKDIEMDYILKDNVITPQFSFSSKYFVKVYYKIASLEDMLKWLDKNKQSPYKTKERVFNNGMVAYGKDMMIIDHRIVFFVRDIMITNLPKLYRHLKIYFSVSKNSIDLANPGSELYTEISEDSKTIKMVRQYIKEKFLGDDSIHQFMSKFVRYYKDELIDRHISDTLVQHMIDYITKRIQLTFEQE